MLEKTRATSGADEKTPSRAQYFSWINHTNEGSDINGCYLRVTLETRNFEHIHTIKQALTDAGIKIL